MKHLNVFSNSNRRRKTTPKITPKRSSFSNRLDFQMRTNHYSYSDLTAFEMFFWPQIEAPETDKIVFFDSSKTLKCLYTKHLDVFFISSEHVRCPFLAHFWSSFWDHTKTRCLQNLAKTMTVQWFWQFWGHFRAAIWSYFWTSNWWHFELLLNVFGSAF